MLDKLKHFVPESAGQPAGISGLSALKAVHSMLCKPGDNQHLHYNLVAIKVVSSAYLRLLMFLLAILIPACASFSPAFLMIYSAYKLNKQGDNIQPRRTPFPIWTQSVVPRPVLTVASWLAYRFHKRQVRWSGIPISLRIFHSLWWSTQFVVIHTGFGIVNKAEVDVFLELSYFFDNLGKIIPE